jgi:Domain of Unknown Function (DUF1259)
MMNRGLLPVLLVAALMIPSPGRLSAQPTADWSATDKALGRAGADQPGGVHKFSFPRSDLRVAIGDVAIKPALALGSWVAFKRASDGQSMAMGDLVLTPDEVAAVMAKLQQGGVEQSALHNHLVGEAPHVMYMHIMAKGDASKIAQTIYDALALTKTPLQAPAAAPPVAAAGFDTTGFASALGYSGKSNGGVYQISVPRPEPIREGNDDVPPSMGVATAINVQPTTGGRAVTTGDFVLLPGEVNAVIRALKANGIAVTALHSHLMMDQPHVLFMHFWGNDEATKLAAGLRAALDATGMAPKRVTK